VMCMRKAATRREGDPPPNESPHCPERELPASTLLPPGNIQLIALAQQVQTLTMVVRRYINNAILGHLAAARNPYGSGHQTPW